MVAELVLLGSRIVTVGLTEAASLWDRERSGVLWKVLEASGNELLSCIRPPVGAAAASTGGFSELSFSL